MSFREHYKNAWVQDQFWVHFDAIILRGLGGGPFSLCGCAVSPVLLVEKAVFFSTELLLQLCQNQLGVFVGVGFLLCALSIGLCVCPSPCITVPYVWRCPSTVIPQNLVFFFKIVLVLLLSHIHFKIILSITTKRSCGDFDRNDTKLPCPRGENRHLYYVASQSMNSTCLFLF